MMVTPTPRLVQLASMVNSPMPASTARAGAPSCSFGSFASGPVAMRSAALARTMRGKPAMPLLRGMGAPASLPLTSARTYYTEGEIFGTTFMYTTNMMFWAGIVGAVAFRRNLIILLLSAETVMLACNMNFLFTAAYLNDITGAIMSITITTIAACETVSCSVGLSVRRAPPPSQPGAAGALAGAPAWLVRLTPRSPCASGARLLSIPRL